VLRYAAALLHSVRIAACIGHPAGLDPARQVIGAPTRRTDVSALR
jgi:hypothetical protein